MIEKQAASAVVDLVLAVLMRRHNLITIMNMMTTSAIYPDLSVILDRCSNAKTLILRLLFSASFQTYSAIAAVILILKNAPGNVYENNVLTPAEQTFQFSLSLWHVLEERVFCRKTNNSQQK
jgi:hypothetical protein